jgi:hypothetical protein
VVQEKVEGVENDAGFDEAVVVELAQVLDLRHAPLLVLEVGVLRSKQVVD